MGEGKERTTVKERGNLATTTQRVVLSVAPSVAQNVALSIAHNVAQNVAQSVA